MGGWLAVVASGFLTLLRDAIFHLLMSVPAVFWWFFWGFSQSLLCFCMYVNRLDLYSSFGAGISKQGNGRKICRALSDVFLFRLPCFQVSEFRSMGLILLTLFHHLSVLVLFITGFKVTYMIMFRNNKCVYIHPFKKKLLICNNSS